MLAANTLHITQSFIYSKLASMHHNENLCLVLRVSYKTLSIFPLAKASLGHSCYEHLNSPTALHCWPQQTPTLVWSTLTQRCPNHHIRVRNTRKKFFFPVPPFPKAASCLVAQQPASVRELSTFKLSKGHEMLVVLLRKWTCFSLQRATSFWVKTEGLWYRWYLALGDWSASSISCV